MSKFKINITTSNGKFEFDCYDYQYILDAAEEASIYLPSACRVGSCSTCCAKVVMGTLDQSAQNYLDDYQIEEGFVMLCVAYPTSDCIIRGETEEELLS